MPTSPAPTAKPSPPALSDPYTVCVHGGMVTSPNLDVQTCNGPLSAAELACVRAAMPTNSGPAARNTSDQLSASAWACVQADMPTPSPASLSQPTEPSLQRVPAAPVQADLAPSLPVTVLGRLDTHAANALKAFGVFTVGELEALLARPDAASKHVLGKRSFTFLTGLLERARTGGLARAVFGTDRVPDTAAALFAAWLARLDTPRTRAIFHARFAEGLTLQATADKVQHGLSRERIRQVVAKKLAEHRGAWGPVAEKLLAPVEALVESSGGLVPLEGCLAVCGASCEGELEFLVQLAAASERLTLVTVSGATVVAAGDRDSVKLRRGCIRSALDEALASNATLEAARRVLREFQVQLPPALEAVLLRDFLWVEVSDTAAYSNRRKVQKMWVETLRGLDGPASAAEVVAEAQRRHPGEPFLNPHNATTHFLRSKDVFSLGRDAWCHRDHLGVDRTTLDSLAEACLAVLPRTPEGSHVGALLKLAGKSLPPELSPERLGGGDPHYVIRDALRHTGKVRSWRNVLELAYRDVDAHRVSIAERLLEAGRKLPQPFDGADLVEEVVEASGTSEDSVWLRLGMLPEFLGLGGRMYLAWEGIFGTREPFEAEQRRVAALVPQDRPMGARELAALASPGSPVPKLYGNPRVAFGLARAAGLHSLSRAGGLLWRPSLGASAWEALSRSRGFSVPSPLRARDVRAWMKAHLGVDDESLSWVLVQQAREAGVA